MTTREAVAYLLIALMLAGAAIGWGVLATRKRTARRRDRSRIDLMGGRNEEGS